jgi:hypothetical protein
MVKMVDPSYNPEQEKILTKKVVIWCQLFYYFLREGMAKERELSLI